MKPVVIAVTGEHTLRKDVFDAVRCAARVKDTLEAGGFRVENFFLEPQHWEHLRILEKTIADFSPRCVFNLFEGFSNDAQKEVEFVELLEKMKIPFTGSPSHTLDACLHKEKTRAILLTHGIPVPHGIFIKTIADLSHFAVKPPVFVKPAGEDASVGIDKDSLVKNARKLRAVLKEKLHQFPQGVMVEEFVPGREYTVALFGRYPYELLDISMIDYSRHKNFPPFLTYASKWHVDSLEYKTLIPACGAGMNQSLADDIADVARQAGQALGCRGYFRVDIREKEGQIYVIDVNPNSDINEDSGFIRQAGQKGYSYAKVINRILELAVN